MSAERINLRNQEKIINSAYLMLCVMLIPHMALMYYRTTQTGQNQFFVIQSIVIILIYAVALIRKRIPSQTKAFFLAAVSFYSGINSLMTYGFSAGAVVLFFLSVFIVTNFFRLRCGIVLCIASTLAILIVGAFSVNGTIQYQIDFNQYMASYSSWMVQASLFLFIVSILVVASGMYNHSRDELLLEINKQRNELKDNNFLIESINSELGIKNDELLEIATTDKLTQLLNRQKLDDIFIHEIKRSKRYTAPLSIIILDIDHFKSVNDTFGHQIGDNVLIELAKILQNSTRTSDVPGRWGGEEFLIICPETDQEGIGILAEKIRSAIEAFHFETVGTVTISGGTATMTVDDSQDHMIKRADDALYQAKENGRNQITAAKNSE